MDVRWSLVFYVHRSSTGQPQDPNCFFIYFFDIGFADNLDELGIERGSYCGPRAKCVNSGALSV